MGMETGDYADADYDDHGGDGGGGCGGDGDSGYDDDVGDELRCQIIIMPAFLHWQACRVKWQTLGKPAARIANVLASIACGITNAHMLLHFGWQATSASTSFYNIKLL